MPDKNKPNPAAGSDPGSDKNLSRPAAGSNPGSDKNLSRPAAGSNPTTAFHPGDLLLDTYRIESEAFQGGMGAVWRVHHTGWNVDLAMKRPKPQAFRTGEQKDNFTSECRYWMDLGLHPNIVSCYYVREIEGIPTIFSEWMDKGSLESHIKDGTLYEGSAGEVQERLLDISIQFARGLHFAHENKLIHQDVKPDNLLLADNWAAKISDFGLARARTALTFLEGDATVLDNDPEATIVTPSGGRTPAYCSPEQAAGQLLTKRTDIYSWAVSVLEMYLGFKPWAHGRDLTGPLVGYAREAYFDMCVERPLPEALQKLLAQCLEPDPDDRLSDFGSVESVLLSLYAELVGKEYHRPAPSSASVTADHFNNRALSYLDLGEFENAMACWDQALNLDPGHRASVFNRTLALYRTEQIDPRDAEAALDAIQDQEERNHLVELLGREIHTVVTINAEPAKIPLKYTDIFCRGRLVTGCISLFSHEPDPRNRRQYLMEALYDTVSRQYLKVLNAETQYEYRKINGEGKYIESSLDSSSISISMNGHYAAYTILESIPVGDKKYRKPRTEVVDLTNTTNIRKWYIEKWDDKALEIPDAPVIRTFDHGWGLLNPDGTVIGFPLISEKPENCSVIFYNVHDGRLLSRVNGAVLLGFTWAGRVLLFSADNRIIFGGRPDRPAAPDALSCSCKEYYRRAIPGSRLHQVSDRLAVLETGREGKQREGLILDLIRGHVIAPLRWEMGSQFLSYKAAPGSFFLTDDRLYLIWLTGSGSIYVIEGGGKRNRKDTLDSEYALTARLWDTKTGKYIGRSFPAVSSSAMLDQCVRETLLSLSSDRSALRYAPDRRTDYLLSLIASTETRLEAETDFSRIMKCAEKAESRGDILSALRLADEALACPGFEHEINALQFRATAGEGLSKNRLRRIIPLSGTGLLPLGGISAVTGENQSGAGWKEIGKDQIDIDNTISTYVGRETVTEDGRYRLVPTIELWAHYTDTGWENDIQADYVHYCGAAVVDVSEDRILREYYRLYSYKSSTWEHFSTKEYGSVLHSSEDGLLLLTRGKGLDLRRVGDEEAAFHIADGEFQYAAFLRDDRFVLAQRIDGNVEVYDLTGGEESVSYWFTGSDIGQVRIINENCFAVAANGAELICWLDWEYAGEKVTRFAPAAGGLRVPIRVQKAPLFRAELSAALPSAAESLDFNLSKYSGNGRIVTGYSLLRDDSGEYGGVLIVYDRKAGKYLLAVKEEEEGQYIKGRHVSVRRSDLTVSRNGQFAAFEVTETSLKDSAISKITHTAVVDLRDSSHRRKWEVNHDVTEIPECPVLQYFDLSGGILTPGGTAVGFYCRKKTEKESFTVFYSVKTGKVISKVRGALLLGFAWSGKALMLSAKNRVLFGGPPERPLAPDTVSFICEGIDREAAPGSLLHQVSGRLAVLEKGSAGSRKEGLLMDLTEDRVIASVDWEYSEAYNFKPAGAFFLTADGKYLVWLTQDQKPFLVKKDDKWSCQCPYTIIARVWDAETGRLLGESYPIKEIYDTAYDRSRAWGKYRFMRLLLAIREDPDSLVITVPDLC